jgi:hypothetical protein
MATHADNNFALQTSNKYYTAITGKCMAFVAVIQTQASDSCSAHRCESAERVQCINMRAQAAITCLKVRLMNGFQVQKMMQSTKGCVYAKAGRAYAQRSITRAHCCWGDSRAAAPSLFVHAVITVPSSRVSFLQMLACAQRPGLPRARHSAGSQASHYSGEALTSCHACAPVLSTHAFGPCHMEKIYQIGDSQNNFITRTMTRLGS